MSGEQGRALVLRAIAVGDQLDAANRAARAIVGPERPAPPAVLTALRVLVARGDLDHPQLCEHLDAGAPGVWWWCPATPDLITCRECHERGHEHGKRCDACRRTGQRTRSVLYLVGAVAPTVIDAHRLTARPPVIVDFSVCQRCRDSGQRR